MERQGYSVRIHGYKVTIFLENKFCENTRSLWHLPGALQKNAACQLALQLTLQRTATHSATHIQHTPQHRIVRPLRYSLGALQKKDTNRRALQKHALKHSLQHTLQHESLRWSANRCAYCRIMRFITALF